MVSTKVVYRVYRGCCGKFLNSSKICHGSYCEEDKLYKGLIRTNATKQELNMTDRYKNKLVSCSEPGSKSCTRWHTQDNSEIGTKIKNSSRIIETTKMAADRIYQNEHEIGEMAVESVDCHGGAPSSMTNDELETQRNAMTLKEARWQGVRKKAPRIMKKKLNTKQSSKTNEIAQNPYLEHIQKMTTFINDHFHRKECERFVPRPGQLEGVKAVKKNGDLKCHCGEVLMEHSFMQMVNNNNKLSSPRGYLRRPSSDIPNFDETTQLDIYVPAEIREHFTRKQRQKLSYTPPPGLDWKSSDIKRRLGDCTFGKINFENMEHIGGRKPAKYIRMTDDDEVDDLLLLMKDYWKIMEPEKPNLVISVVGGAKNFKLDGRMRDTFATGLIKAAKTTSAWLISSGFNMGVMKAVGQAVRQGQSFCWDNERMAHVLRCIGIAPWGYVMKRKVLESHDGQGKFNANYRTSNVILHDSAVPLNPDHTHFIFVDDGRRIKYGGVAGIRAKLEQKISDSENGLGIPVVLVVVEGGVDAIKDAKTSLEHNIPVVICAGTGRAADIIAYAFTHTKSSGGHRIMKPKHEEKLMKKIDEAYGKSPAEAQQICEQVKFCCQNPDLLIVFYMNKHEDLDLAILSVLLKAKKGADEKQRLSQLNLALMWDRVDIAQEEIFREDVLWSRGSLDDTLTRALVTNKVKFVDLILQQGSLVMKEYLTKSRLQALYNEVPKSSYLYKILHKMVGKETLNLENVYILCKRLLDKYDTVKSSLEQDEEAGKEKDTFQRPYKMLLVWAVLLCRVDMAKLFLELGEEPVTSALAATRIVHALAKNMPHLESNIRDKLSQAEHEFERLAICIVNECHQEDPDKAMMIVERKSPCWNDMTCLQIAAASSDQGFLATGTCQQSIDVTWKRGILSTWYKLFLAMLFPPYIIWGIEILNPGQEKLSTVKKMLLFYSSPLSKFSYGVLMYGVFLTLHSYLVLVDFREHQVTPIEIIVVLWVFTFCIDSAHTIIAFPTPTFRAKIRDWFDFFNWLQLMNYGLAIAGFIAHVAGHYSVAKVMYCVCSVMFFLAIMKIYVAHGQLGPKIFMIRKMGSELRMFIMVLVVFLLAYGVGSQGLLYLQRSPDWVILKDVIYFPYWQLYGEIELDAIANDESCDAGSSNCKTFHWLVPILLMFYMLVGNILLLNLLIAIFSHVFQTVEENSNKIWKYQRYFLAMEYECKTHLAPPFSLFQHAYLALRWVIYKLCCPKQKKEPRYAKYQLDYLQLFEKEMMMNFLRMEKAAEMSGIEMTVNRLQKRVDALTKLIEDEIIADQEPAGNFTDTVGPSTDNLQMQFGEFFQQAQKFQNEFEKEAKKKRKKERKEKKRKRKEEKQKASLSADKLIESDIYKSQEEKNISERQIQKQTNTYEEKLNNINLPPNISGIEDKPEPGKKVFNKPSERSVSFLIHDESASDNASPVTPKRPSLGGSNDMELTSPRWIPASQRAQRMQSISDDDDDDDDEDELPRKRAGLRSRFSGGILQHVSSGSEEEEEETSFRQKFKKRFQKKKKKQFIRNLSDTE